MVLWRISRHHDLNGIGGLRAAGRWHHAGQPVVYMSEHPASALLEVCVHTAASDVPPAFTLLRIEGPEVLVSSPLSSTDEDVLPDDWQVQFDFTRDLGTRWLKEGQAVLLQVPSAIVPGTANYLFNPRHADAKLFCIAEALQYPFDFRLKA